MGLGEMPLSEDSAGVGRPLQWGLALPTVISFLSEAVGLPKVTWRTPSGGFQQGVLPKGPREGLRFHHSVAPELGGSGPVRAATAQTRSPASPVCATRVPGAGMARCAALAVPFPPFAAGTGREALQVLLWDAVSQMAFEKERIPRQHVLNLKS